MRFLTVILCFILCSNLSYSADYYWVGGTGEWSTPSNWATTANGTVLYNTLPGSGDDVFFTDLNGNPNYTVNINSTTVQCRNMVWQNTSPASLTGQVNSNLEIFGNITIPVQVSVLFEGNIYFKGTAINNQINLQDHVLKSNIYFAGDDDRTRWLIAAKLETEKSIYLERGVLDARDIDLICSQFISRDSSKKRGFDFTRSRIQIRNRLQFTPNEQWLVDHENLIPGNLDNSNITIQEGKFEVRWQSTSTVVEYNSLEFLGDGVVSFFGPNGFFFDGSLKFNRNGIIEHSSSGSLISITELILEGGYLYQLSAGINLITSSLKVNGFCTGLASIFSSQPGKSASLTVPQNSVYEYLILRDIVVPNTGNFIANNSIDLGGNSNSRINFQSPLQPRKLYWVNGPGNWIETSHWSLESNGTGNQCPPTPLDTVIFDDGSGLNNNDEINAAGSQQKHARLLDMRALTATPKFSIFNLNIYGSIFLKPNLGSNMFNISFRTESLEEVIDLKNFTSLISFEGTGSWNLNSLLQSNQINFSGGHLKTNGFNLELGNPNQYYTSINFYGSSKKIIELTDNLMLLEGQITSWSAFCDSLIVVPNNSTLQFEGNQNNIFLNQGLTDSKSGSQLNFNKVIFANGQASLFSNPKGVDSPSPIVDFMDIRGSAKFQFGFNDIDTVYFTQGETYQFYTDTVLQVNKLWNLMGNGCQYIKLETTQSNTQRAQVLITNNTVVNADFLEIKNIAITPGNVSAGGNSRDLGNNLGWVFGGNSTPGSNMGYLGSDFYLCPGETKILTAPSNGDNLTFTWRKDGNVTGSNDSTLFINSAGLYISEVNFNSVSCSISDTIQVLDGSAINTLDIGNDLDLCEGFSSPLNAGINDPFAKFLWHDNSTDSIFLATQQGKVKVTVDLGGCIASDSIMVNVVTVPDPILPNDTTLCFGESFSISVNASIYPEFELNGSNSPNITLVNSETVILEVWDINRNCPSKSDTVIVTFNPQIIVNLGGDAQICEGESKTLNPNTNFPSASYLWSTGATTPTITVNSEDTYKVTVTANNCQASDSIDLEVNLKPVIELGSDTTLCEGESITLSPGNPGLDPNTLLQWNDGLPSFGPTLLINSNSKVFLTAISPDQCESMDSINITFQPFPIINLDPIYESCEGQSISLDVTNPGATYLWQPLGTTGPTQNISSPSQYSVEVNLNGCIREYQFEAIFKPLPIFDLGNDTTLCEGEIINISLAGAGDSYLWSTGSTLDQIQISNADTVNVSVTKNGCSKQDEIRVTFKPNPIVNLGNDTIICENDILILSSITPGATYLWQDGSIDSAFMVGLSGNYSLEVDLNGCIKYDDINVTLNPLPVFDLGKDTLLCSGENITISANVPGGSYNWLNPAGNTNSSVTVNNKGSYILDVSLNGCSARDSIFVDYVNLTNNFLGVDQSVCEGEQIDINIEYSDHPGAQYTWDNFTTLPTRSITQSGTYSATITLGKCIVNDEVTYTFNELPKFTLGPDLRLCEDETVDLTIEVNNALQYLWNDRSTMDQKTVRFPGGLIWGEAKRNNCVFRDSVIINYDQIPAINLGPDTTICADRSVTLKSGADAERYVWQDGSTGPTLLAETGGIYRLEATNGVCSAVDSVIITATECYYFNVYVPNAFSPNNDGVNDELLPFLPPQIQVVTFEMNIFDRWGNLIFTTSDPTFSWDGRRNGKEMPNGIYIYSLQMEYIDDLGPGKTRRRGDFMLLK